VEEARSQTNLPYKFTGKELDPETGLYYFGARYYDPRVSVWVSVDPIIDEYLEGKPNSGIYNAININLYRYAALNPVRLTDPTGTSEQDELAAMVANEEARRQIAVEKTKQIADGFEAAGDGLASINPVFAAHSAVTGKSAMGKELSAGDRTMEGAALLLPFIKFGRGLKALFRFGNKTDDVGSALKIAQAGGKHAGQLKQILKQTPEQLQKTINSFEKQIENHKRWIKDPASKVEKFDSLRPDHQQNLIHHWQQDILRHQELKSIAEKVSKGL
jgi:RHS repeat-associated protein